jgi:hypothetical protein
VFAVVLGVVAAGFGMVFFSVAGMAVRAVRVMRGLLVIPGFVMLGSFAMMLRRMFVVLGRLVMMLDACVVAHICSPGFDSPNSARSRLAL